MNKIILAGIFAFFTAVSSYAQTSDEKAIKQTIMEFSKAGDANDGDKLEALMDDNYRIIMNRLFGSTEVVIMPKEVYLEKIKSKEYGGDNRKVGVESITLNGTTASAKVSFIGTEMAFESILILIKDGNNQWRVVSDVPIVK